MEGSPSVLTGPFAGRYTIERELGRGGTATVYLARDDREQRAVAIKVLKPELAQSMGPDRFLREIKLTERLHHPNIVPVLDSGEHDGLLYFVLPLMEQGTLRHRMQREGQLEIDTAVTIACNLADALSHAHKQGFVHRDVKPENILFSGGQVCLADFGIARAIERSIDDPTTSTGFIRGTPAYMSPEQASGEHNYDGRSDIYSLACVLYEMIAGMPAFIGPTLKAVMAQRFQHAPRPVRVYRPSTPPSLEAALERALQLEPADRYRTADEFSKALAMGARSPVVPPPRSVLRRDKRAVAGSLLALGVVGLAFGTWRPWESGFGFGGSAPDTTRILILPPDGDSAAPRGQTYDLMEQGLSAWRGIKVVDRSAMVEARGSELPVASDREAMRVARSVGAGRYVRARITRVGNQWRVWTGLYDVVNPSRLYEASSVLQSNLAGADSAIAHQANALMLRRLDGIDPGSRVLPAVQRFDAGLREVDAFNLRRADTLFLAALETDSSYARAAVWLAQVRNWNLKPSDTWVTWVERGSAGNGLTPREQLLARALVNLGKSNFPGACQVYDSLRRLNARDFASWYGLGQCHRKDDVVIRDVRSPSGWRFRGSSHQAALAYARAFELAPALQQNFQARAYSELRDLLYSMRSLLRQGNALAPDTSRFLAYASWAGDTLVHIPYPRELVRRGLVTVNPRARAEALANQRELFSRVAQSWAAALPRSPATKEALAISLEMVGDAGAIDTLRSARALASDPQVRMRLAAEEVFMRISFARRSPKVIGEALTLADSLLNGVGEASQEEATILAPVAAVVGKCHTAAHLAARSVSKSQAAALELSRSVAAAAESLTVLSAMGCRSPADTIGIRSLLDEAGPVASRDALENNLFGRAVILTYPLDSARLSRLARSSGDYIMDVQMAALSRDTAKVRSILAQKQRVRSAADVTPDAAYPEARSWMAIGNPASARAWIDPILMRQSWLELMLNDPINAAGLLRSVALRAELADSQNDKRTARRWALLIAQLWARSDDNLRPVTRRMVVLSGMQ